MINKFGLIYLRNPRGLKKRILWQFSLAGFSNRNQIVQRCDNFFYAIFCCCVAWCHIANCGNATFESFQGGNFNMLGHEPCFFGQENSQCGPVSFKCPWVADNFMARGGSSLSFEESQESDYGLIALSNPNAVFGFSHTNQKEKPSYKSPYYYTEIGNYYGIHFMFFLFDLLVGVTLAYFSVCMILYVEIRYPWWVFRFRSWQRRRKQRLIS